MQLNLFKNMGDERLSIWMSFSKFIIFIFVFGYIAYYIDNQLQQRKLTSNENRVELDFVGQYVDIAKSKNLADKRLFAEYFSIMAPTERFRSRWKRYLHVVNDQLAHVKHEENQAIEEVKRLEDAFAKAQRKLISYTDEIKHINTSSDLDRTAIVTQLDEYKNELEDTRDRLLATEKQLQSLKFIQTPHTPLHENNPIKSKTTLHDNDPHKGGLNNSLYDSDPYQLHNYEPWFPQE